MTTLRASSRWIVVVVSLVLIALPVGGAANDLNELLDGDYAFSLTNPCVQANVSGEPFGSGLEVPPGGATTRTNIIEGVYSYDGDGTGSATETVLTINHDRTNPGDTPVVFATLTADLTFTVNPDRSFTQELVNFRFTILNVSPSLTGTIVVGPIEGQIGDGGRTLVFKETEPDRETLTVDQTGGIFERICGRSGVAVKIEEDDDD